MPHPSDNRRRFRPVGAAADATLLVAAARRKRRFTAATHQKRELLGRGVMEGEMDPGGPSPPNHAHRFVELEASCATTAATHL
jgi:hypothetical protein